MVSRWTAASDYDYSEEMGDPVARQRRSERPTMAIGYGKPCPKPRPRILDRIEVKREADRRGKAFRAAVWARDGGRCRNCQRKVFHTLEAIPERGEVHHRRGRNVTPENRYNVHEAVLLCLVCHSDPDVIAKFRRRA